MAMLFPGAVGRYQRCTSLPNSGDVTCEGLGGMIRFIHNQYDSELMVDLMNSMVSVCHANAVALL